MHAVFFLIAYSYSIQNTFLRARTLYTTKSMCRNTINRIYVSKTCFIIFFPLLSTLFLTLAQTIIELFLNDYCVTLLFYEPFLRYLCVFVCMFMFWQYGCTSQLASDKQYRLQAQLAHVVSRIDILFYFSFLIYDIYIYIFFFNSCVFIEAVFLDLFIFQTITP